jgi:hypothetical protein
VAQSPVGTIGAGSRRRRDAGDAPANQFRRDDASSVKHIPLIILEIVPTKKLDELFLEGSLG